jgi:hypothetical protein
MENKLNNIKIRRQVLEINQLKTNYDFEIDQNLFGQNKNFTFDIFFDSSSVTILNKLSQKSENLGEVCYIRQCIKTGNDGIYVKQSQEKLPEPWKPTLRGRSINRYKTLVDDEYVKYGKWLARNWKNKTFYETPKIVVRETGKKIIATIDTDDRFVLSSLYSIYPKENHSNISLKYLLGLLNSKLATYVAKLIALNLTEGAFTKIRTNQLARLPIKTINLSDKLEVSQHDRMVALVERMLELHKRNPQTPQEADRLQREITATDGAIDKLVYELYGLTEEEVRIVEGGS